MRRILVFSDTHRDTTAMFRAVETIGEVDLIIHCGDVLQDFEDLKVVFPSIPCQYVRGNNDFRGGYDYEQILDIFGVKIFFTHGHLYSVKMSLDKLIEAGKKHGADIVLFGHTHEASLEHTGRFILMNPGSANFYYSGTYGIIEIEEVDGENKISADILEMM